MADPDLILARQIAVDVPDPTWADFEQTERAQRDADILMGRCDAAWSIQAITEAVRRGRAQADAEHRTALQRSSDRITVLEAAIQPFAAAAATISTFWSGERHILKPEGGRGAVLYADIRMAARAVGLPASVEETEIPTE